MSEFTEFRAIIQKQFDKMAKNGKLFMSEVSKDDVWNTYLDSFPEGTNKIFRERREYDCVCCKQYIRYIGRVLGQDKDGNLVSVWDLKVDNFFQEVADALSKLNKEAGIGGIFLHNEREIGKPYTIEKNEAGDIRWEHYHQVLPEAVVTNNVARLKGEAQTHRKVLKRSLEEITEDSIETVMDLIAQNSLYRGEEHKSTVELLKRTQRDYNEASNKDLFLWDKAVDLKGVCAFRNIVIGTLLVDLSNDVELEVAVKKFEDKVAPHNYKRSKALVTPRMKEEAKKKAQELGIEPSLVRRYATKEDMSVNNVLFADQATKPFMEDSVFDVVKPTNQNLSKKNLDKVQVVAVDKFIKDILPTAESIELYLENKHESNLMSLIAPVNGSAPCIMKWGNNFSWSYKGETTDSMKERVKAAGGKVDGDLRFSIQWNDQDDNKNDLDAHCIEPSKNLIYYGSKRSFATGGDLDVDIMDPRGTAVENITFPNRSRMTEGVYTFLVHNYSERGGRNWSAEIEFDGNVFEFSYDGGMRSNEKVIVAKVKYTHKNGFELVPVMKEKSATKEVYDLDTNNFHKVNMVMQSPNFWDGKEIGNKHMFFILDGCKNPDDARGFYQEFMIEDLKEHRKVFEVLGANLKAPYSDDQLSGVGFSSTVRNEVLLKVSGTFNRMIKVVF